jgi:hypothetical protein
MSEQEQDQMHQLLSQTMSAPVPRLSADFDRTLSRRLQSTRLDRRGRLVLAAYSAFALIASIWAMREVATEWPIIVGFVLVPICVMAVVFRRHLRLATGHSG